MRTSLWLMLLAAGLMLAGCGSEATRPTSTASSSSTTAPAPTPASSTTEPAAASTEPTPMTENQARDNASAPQRATAVFAGGCFWCVEAVFEQLDGVYDAVSGYAGGSAETANYKDVCTGTTGHAEVVQIIYDPTRISYEKLLEVHFATHDPTTLNRQGNDIGPQYRSAIFYANEEERRIAEAYIKKLQASGRYDKPIVTTLEPLEAFYEAERYHQDYARQNPLQGYIQAVAMPKVEKVRKLFKDDLKE